MYYIAVLILITILLYFSLRSHLSSIFLRKQSEYARLESEYSKLSEGELSLKKDNQGLKDSLQETVALYDIMQDICKSFDEKQIFTVFKERAAKFIEISDCVFLTPKTDISRYADYKIMPLLIDKDVGGYLAAKGVGDSDADKFHILAQQLFLGMKRALLYKNIHELAITDTLTFAFSRRYFLDRLQEEAERCQRLNYKFSFLMADIDKFKSYNDRYGHLVGDVILREVARTVKETIRQVDFFGRYGGEELALVLTETDKNEAYFAAERIRQAVELRKIHAYDEIVKVTVSIGISTFPTDAKDTEALIDSADKAMYRAKDAGRNRVFAAG